MNPPKATLVSFQASLVFLTISYIAIALYLWLGLDYTFLQSDVMWYWGDSLEWRAPFNPYHIPGYPLTIALLRGLTLNALPPELVMMSITFVAMLLSALAVYRIMQLNNLPATYAAAASCLFGVWPCVGLVYAVFPIADLAAIVWLLSGFVALLQARLRLAALLLGIALIFHKAMWPFVATLLIADQLKYNFRFLKNPLACFILITPLAVLWWLGTLHHHSPLWLLSSSLEIGFAAQTEASVPFLQGIIGTFTHKGGYVGLAKGGLVAVLALTALLLIFTSYRKKFQNYQYAIAISLTCLFFLVATNYQEIFSAVRYSRLLVIPLILVLANLNWTNVLGYRQVVGILTVLLLTQFGYAWYIAKVFFVPGSSGVQSYLDKQKK